MRQIHPDVGLLIHSIMALFWHGSICFFNDRNIRLYLVFHVLILAFLSKVSADNVHDTFSFRRFCCYGVCIPVLHQEIFSKPAVSISLNSFGLALWIRCSSSFASPAYHWPAPIVIAFSLLQFAPTPQSRNNPAYHMPDLRIPLRTVFFSTQLYFAYP